MNALSDLMNSSLTVEVIRFPENSDRWNLVNEYLKLRKEVFVDKLDWPLFHAENLEFEQYDSFNTVYVIASSGGMVVGGARLRRTDQLIGTGQVSYSYMIRDACLGLLPGLPETLYDTVPPIDKSIWELTRLVVKDSRNVSRAILDKADSFLALEGAQSALFLGSPAFMRIASSMGWHVSPKGPLCRNAEGSFRVYECQVAKRCGDSQ